MIMMMMMMRMTMMISKAVLALYLWSGQYQYYHIHGVDATNAEIPLSEQVVVTNDLPECQVIVDENGNTLTNNNNENNNNNERCLSPVGDTTVMDIANHQNTTDNDDKFRDGSDLGVPQRFDAAWEDRGMDAIRAARQYVQQQQQDVAAVTTECRHTDELCVFWSLMGECTENPTYMQYYCAPACRTCHLLKDGAPQVLQDEDEEEVKEDQHQGEEVVEEEELDEETRALRLRQGSDIGVLQSTEDTEYGPRIIEAIAATQRYMREVVQVEPSYEKVRDLCRNTHESCTYWSLIGECTVNPGFMLIHCAPACQTCDQVHVETRCPMDENATLIFGKPNDLNQFYERIIHDPFFQTQFNVTVLSRPDDSGAGFWVVQFDNILNDTDAQRLIDLGRKEGYERSADVGDAKPDGTFDSLVNEGRTSTNAWCMEEGCMDDPVTMALLDRLENITTIPRVNYENLQILQYEEHQFYNEHNDFIEYQVERPCGSRILTFYMYLNTLPDDGGGGTNFPRLNLTVTPKLGRAIMWPSVLDESPLEMDPLSNHQALPVLNGHVKYGVNAWIHQRDFQHSNHIGCA